MSQRIPHTNAFLLPTGVCCRRLLWLAGTVVAAFSGTLPDAAQCGEPDDSGAWQVSMPLPSSVSLPERIPQNDADVDYQRFQFLAARDFQTVELRLPQQPALAVDDFAATVTVNSSQRGIRFGLQLILPRQIDPRTGRPLATVLFGDRCEETETWQVLSATVTPSGLEAKIRELRAEINRPEIDTTGMYIDECVLVAELHRGVSTIDVRDGSTYGPIVRPEATFLQGARDQPTKVHEVAGRARVRIERNRVQVEGVPILPRFIPDHGESISYFDRLGVNGVWLPDLQVTGRMQEFRERGILVLATPPHPEFDPADFSRPLQGLPPLEQTFPQPDIWYLGTAVRANQLPHLLAWAREVRSADRALRRPLAADVVTGEGIASRKVDFVGISQNSLGSLTSFGESRNRSFLRQNASAQLTLPWEWIQTEHAREFQDWRRRTGSTEAVAEPEQIMMQVVACLSAGSRGLGFWKTRSRESESPEDLEISMAIELANLYLDILEPLLIPGNVDGHIPVRTSETPQEPNSKDWLSSVIGAGGSPGLKYTVAPTGPDATIINSPGTSLILGGFWDTASQYVPQEMYSARASLTVAATETASAWRLSPTSVAGLRRQRSAGGLRLDLDDFDQFAIVLVSSDLEKRRLLQSRVQQTAGRAGQLFVDLATLKLARVRQTCQQIDELAGPDSTADRRLDGAALLIERARTAFSRRDFPTTEKLARESMRVVRGVQNRYWYRAIQSLPTPTASPHTICFATLSDHWAMLRRIDSGTASENLLPSGSFDNQLLSEGAWNPVVTQEQRFHASAEIVSENGGRNRVMRMRAWQRSGSASASSSQPALLVQCPPLQALAGDILEITGKIKFGQGIQTSQSAPLLIFDSDLGPEHAVSPSLEPSWRTFRVLRQASESGEFKVWLALKGPAEVYVDDFSVVRRARMPLESLPQFGNSEPRPAQGNGSRVQGAGYSLPSLP